jgi:hypothetical protein
MLLELSSIYNRRPPLLKGLEGSHYVSSFVNVPKVCLKLLNEASLSDKDILSALVSRRSDSSISCLVAYVVR